MKPSDASRWRTLAVCADDFGLAPGVSSAIARLARAQRISAISCITNTLPWVSDARLLANLPRSVDVGLHVNLTEGRPLSRRLAALWPTLPGLSELILRAHLRQLPLAELRIEVHRQLIAFRDATGSDPAHVDGHQHVHHLPGLRSIILDMAEQLHPRAAVRSTALLPGPGFGRKRWLIRHTGATALATELDKRGLLHNPMLLGVHDFRTSHYRLLMQRWIARIPAGGALLFCHPGSGDASVAADPIAKARARELAYFESDAWPQDLAQAQVQPGRVWQLAPTTA